MELTLEQFQQYPPTLKIMWENVICRFEGIDYDNESLILERVNVPLDEVKPILRPITSELLDDFQNSVDKYVLQQIIKGDTHAYYWLTYGSVQYLLKNHYDIFGWIDADLALNINKLVE